MTLNQKVGLSSSKQLVEDSCVAVRGAVTLFSISPFLGVHRDSEGLS